MRFDRIAKYACSLAAAALATSPAWGGIAFTANEQTVTISVIDTATDTVVDTIGLGSDPPMAGTPQPAGPLNGEADHHRPFYNGHVDPHGLGLTSDGKVLLVACRISGTVVAIDTQTRKVLGYVPVGREPHIAVVRPGDKEAWVAVRGEDYVDVIKLSDRRLRDATRRRTNRLRLSGPVETMLGPSQVGFTSDGRSAFVVSGKQAVVQKFDANSRQLIASRAVVAPFSPFGDVSPDDRFLIVVHKGAGSFSILRTSDLSFVVEAVPIGPRANHAEFVGDHLVYLTIGGPAPSAANPDPEGKIVIFDLNALSIVRELTGPTWNGEPHGIWDVGGKLYVGHERGNRVTVLNYGDPNDPNDDFVAGLVTGTPTQLAFMKRIIDVVAMPSGH
jgi:YVTN family beta-propeller protein